MTQIEPRPEQAPAGLAGRIARISLTPVKGLALEHPSAIELGRDGAPGDRRFYLVDDAGVLVAGKRLGRLVQLRARLDEPAGRLELELPGGELVAGEVRDGRPLETSFHGQPRQAIAVDGPWSEAISAWAGRPLRLVRPERRGEGVDRGRSGAVTLLSVASLEELRRATACDGELDSRRFRMLFLVDGVAAHGEDAWLGRRLRVGGAIVRVNGNVGRCAVTTQDPETGRPDVDTLGALAAYRGSLPSTEPLPFGVWGEVDAPGRVRLGDAVSLLDA